MASVIVLGRALETKSHVDLTASECWQLVDRNCPLCEGHAFLNAYTDWKSNAGNMCYCVILEFYRGLKRTEQANLTSSKLPFTMKST